MTAFPIHIHTREKWGRMAKTIVGRLQDLTGERKQVRALPLHEVEPMTLVSDPPVTVQLSEEQTERVRELEEHGPAAR
jgi:hypothetical protein